MFITHGLWICIMYKYVDYHLYWSRVASLYIILVYCFIKLSALFFHVSVLFFHVSAWKALWDCCFNKNIAQCCFTLSSFITNKSEKKSIYKFYIHIKRWLCLFAECADLLNFASSAIFYYFLCSIEVKKAIAHVDKDIARVSCQML